MARLKRLLSLWFICSQMLVVSISSSGVAAAYDQLHVATVHQVAIDHHHHDDFSSHVDQDDSTGAHIHVVDSFQPFGLIQENSSDVKLFGCQTQSNLLIARPPEIFLEGLLRPPQTIL